MEAQILELREIVSQNQESAIVHSSRVPVIRGGLASAPPSEAAGGITKDEISTYKYLQKKVRKYREQLDNEDDEQYEDDIVEIQQTNDVDNYDEYWKMG